MKILQKIIGVSVGLVVAGLLVPMGINSIANATFAETVDPSVVTMFTIVVPVIAVIAIVLYFLMVD